MSKDIIRPAWMEIDIDNLIYNIKNVKSHIKEGTKLMAVVKGNSYGAGSVECSKIFLENGADMIGVSTLIEALELRDNGIDAPILVLGYTQSLEFNRVIENDITQTIYTYEQAVEISKEAKKQNRVAKIHIKLDTGLSRIGFSDTDESVEKIKDIIKLENIELEGIFSHFLDSENDDKTICNEQYERFKSFNDKLERNNIDLKIKHLCDSAGTIDLPEEYHLDMVRVGILLYGMYPKNVIKENIDIKLASSLKTKVAYSKLVKKGTYVGYGREYLTKEDERIITIPLGYADGYNKGMGKSGDGKISDMALEVAGEIGMDQSMLHTKKENNIEVDDIITIYDESDRDFVKVREVTNIGRRVPRVYKKDGEIIKVKNYLL